MRSATRAGLLLATSMLLASCGNPVETVMSGSWNLEALNGEPIPVQLASTPVSRTLVDGKLLVFPDGTYSYDFEYSVREGTGPFKREFAAEEGEWVRNGEDITLTNSATAAVMSGRVYGTKMRLNVGRDVHDFYLILVDPTLDGGKDNRMVERN